MMNRLLKFSVRILVAALPLATLLISNATAQDRTIPESLQPWEDWVTWDEALYGSPTTYRDANERLPIWPSRLSLATDKSSGSWELSVTVFSESWLGLPGDSKLWPLEVKAGESEIPVLERDGRPAVQLQPGEYKLSGKFAWDEMPQRISVPQEVGMLSLTVDDQLIELPRWDTSGHVWLKRVRAEEAEKDLLTAQVYRVIVDGIPTQLVTEIELTVSGQSREENLGSILPDGFKLSTVNSPIPVAVDAQGRMKAQVRAGKWIISTTAFRSLNQSEVAFAADIQPIINRELIAFRAKPEFRLAEIEGLQTVDVSQTTFPKKWRNLPVYRWETSVPFQIKEKVRGMGLRQPEGLSIQRRFWLDENGKSLTAQDLIRGKTQQIWRLDASEGQELGAVRIDGEAQLITQNPQTGLKGVELRSRNLNLDAISRVNDLDQLRATGWEADVDSLDITFNLPPGWRVFAIFNADRVDGDWLTAWSLLDLFLLLIFAIAVYRMWGFPAGLLAFVAVGLAYHEPSSPRWTWLFLLMPIALLRVVPEGEAKRLIQKWKYVAVGLLVINLVPFIAQQIQSAIYPQLEFSTFTYLPYSRSMIQTSVDTTSIQSAFREHQSVQRESAQLNDKEITQKSRFKTTNLALDPASRIQTGPATPQWTWSEVQCSWDGPVPADQSVRPVFISMRLQRILTVVRVALLALLAAVILEVRALRFPNFKKWGSAAALILLFGVAPDRSWAQEFPNPEMLQTLRERLLEPADVYPHAAEIEHTELEIEGNRIQMRANIHTAIQTAVPLPGQLPVWSPTSVSVDEQPATLVRRKDGYLWVVLPEGIHEVVVESLIPPTSEWEWTFELKPRRVAVSAPGWTVTGIGPNGVPNGPLLFTRQQQTTDADAAYEQSEFNPIIVVNRQLEVGLTWQVRTEVTRLSSDNKSFSLRIPLLAGEQVLSSNTRVADGRIEVSLGSNEDKFSWTSEIPIGAIELSTNPQDTWIERWQLVTSPAWNMSQTGLAPVFETQQQSMIPVWHPWPGEQVTLTFRKPKAVAGDILTVKEVHHAVSMRQRATHLRIDVECSIGSDFVIGVTPEASISLLKHDGQAIPVRRGDDGVIVPLRPGQQSLEVAWKTNDPLAPIVDTGQVKLPVHAANVTTSLEVPNSRWVLWADGPLRGPAVRFWVILATAILIALVLGSIPNSPLRHVEWILLAIGLTQVHIIAALIVVAWLFALSLRGSCNVEQVSSVKFNLAQLGIICLTFVALGTFVVIVAQGLLGHPDMFIVGNSSNHLRLRWFQPRTDFDLPIGRVISVSIWFYKLLMLLWALWLANALLRWLKWGWQQFSNGGIRKNKPILVATAVSDDNAQS